MTPPASKRAWASGVCTTSASRSTTSTAPRNASKPPAPTRAADIDEALGIPHDGPIKGEFKYEGPDGVVFDLSQPGVWQLLITVTATLDWAGCATFRLTVGNVVVFLDAYLDRVADAAQSGLAVDDVDRADFILVGHSHFDHLWGAERIAPRTGATVIGSYETIRLMAAHGVPESQLQPVSGRRAHSPERRRRRLRVPELALVRVDRSRSSNPTWCASATSG